MLEHIWEWQKEKRRLNEAYDWWLFFGLPVALGFLIPLWLWGGS